MSDGNKSFIGRMPNEDNSVLTLNDTVQLSDAFEIETITLPFQAGNGRVGFTFETQVKPILGAESPVVIHIKWSRVQMINDLPEELKEKYGKMYASLLGDLRTHRARSLGIALPGQG